MLGATCLVCGHYPLTQLYQLEDDAKRGDQTLAFMLTEYSGRRLVFVWAIFFVVAGFIANAAALYTFNARMEGAAMLFSCALPVCYLCRWQQRDASQDEDFHRVHFFLRNMALAFGGYILLRLMI
jgi:1,4-dihydroxy-2-naphthoate octaprenyltransferase